MLWIVRAWLSSLHFRLSSTKQFVTDSLLCYRNSSYLGSTLQWINKSKQNNHNHYPKGSMYGIFTYIYHENQLNVGKHTISMDPMGIYNNKSQSVFYIQNPSLSTKNIVEKSGASCLHHLHPKRWNVDLFFSCLPFMKS